MLQEEERVRLYIMKEEEEEEEEEEDDDNEWWWRSGKEGEEATTLGHTCEEGGIGGEKKKRGRMSMWIMMEMIYSEEEKRGVTLCKWRKREGWRLVSAVATDAATRGAR